MDICLSRYIKLDVEAVVHLSWITPDRDASLLQTHNVAKSVWSLTSCDRQVERRGFHLCATFNISIENIHN